VRHVSNSSKFSRLAISWCFAPEYSTEKQSAAEEKEEEGIKAAEEKEEEGIKQSTLRSHMCRHNGKRYQHKGGGWKVLHSIELQELQQFQQ
jgi:hypothetical protein